jgi:hypothetical protein
MAYGFITATLCMACVHLALPPTVHYVLSHGVVSTCHMLLCCLMQVGLVHLDVSNLPGDWESGNPHLPSMGASPDAIITHTIDLPQEVLAAAGAWLAGTDSSASVDDKQQLAVQVVLEAALSTVTCYDSDTDSQEEEDQTEQQQAPSLAVGTAGHLLGSRLQEDLLHLLQQAAAAADSSDTTPHRDVEGSAAAAPAGQEDGSTGTASFNQGSSSSTTSGGNVRLVVREVVEVKNHCPFSYK